MPAWLPSCCANPNGRHRHGDRLGEGRPCIEEVGSNCVEKQGENSVDFEFVGEGRGGYVQSPEYDYVGDGVGSYSPQKIITYQSWRFRKACLWCTYCMLFGVAAVGLLILVGMLKTPAAPGAVEQHHAEFVSVDVAPGSAPQRPDGVPIYDCDDALGLTALKRDYCCGRTGNFCPVGDH